MVGTSKGTNSSAKSAVLSKRRRSVLDDDDDDDDDEAGSSSRSVSSDRTSPPTKMRKVNKHGLVTLQNGVVSMRSLNLAEIVPSKHRDEDALPLFGVKLSFGQAYALFTLVKCGHETPLEKVRDQETRMQILYSAQPYSISADQLSEITQAGSEEQLAFVQGMSKAAVQKLRYNMYGAVGNLFNERVFTKSGVQPYELVKLHLGLQGLVPERSIMDM